MYVYIDISRLGAGLYRAGRLTPLSRRVNFPCSYASLLPVAALALEVPGGLGLVWYGAKQEVGLQMIFTFSPETLAESDCMANYLTSQQGRSGAGSIYYMVTTVGSPRVAAAYYLHVDRVVGGPGGVGWPPSGLLPLLPPRHGGPVTFAGVVEGWRSLGILLQKY